MNDETGFKYWVKAMTGLIVIIIVSVIVGVSGYLREYSDRILKK